MSIPGGGGGFAGTAMYFRSTVAVLVQQSTIGAISGL